MTSPIHAASGRCIAPRTAGLGAPTPAPQSAVGRIYPWRMQSGSLGGGSGPRPLAAARSVLGGICRKAARRTVGTLDVFFRGLVDTVYRDLHRSIAVDRNSPSPGREGGIMDTGQRRRVRGRPLCERWPPSCDVNLFRRHRARIFLHAGPERRLSAQFQTGLHCTRNAQRIAAVCHWLAVSQACVRAQ